jgi:hypothetical protein
MLSPSREPLKTAGLVFGQKQLDLEGNIEQAA